MDFISLIRAVSSNPEEDSTSQFYCHKPGSTQKQKGVSFSTEFYYVPIFTNGQNAKNTVGNCVGISGLLHFCLAKHLGPLEIYIKNICFHPLHQLNYKDH